MKKLAVALALVAGCAQPMTRRDMNIAAGAATVGGFVVISVVAVALLPALDDALVEAFADDAGAACPLCVDGGGP